MVAANPTTALCNACTTGNAALMATPGEFIRMPNWSLGASEPSPHGTLTRLIGSPSCTLGLVVRRPVIPGVAKGANGSPALRAADSTDVPSLSVPSHALNWQSYWATSLLGHTPG